MDITEAPVVTAAGHKILKAAPIQGDWVQADGWVVLCSLPHNPIHPYVVWWMRDNDLTTHNGSYCKTLDEALINWEARS